MALSLNGLEPVNFKGVVCKPELNAEVKLRLSQIKRYDEETDKILASAFPEDEEYVFEFLKAAPVAEKEILHSYLIGGESAASATMDGIKEGIRKVIDTAIKEVK